MELLPEDAVLSLLYYLSPPSVAALFLTCSSFSYLGDKEKVLPLLSHYLPHRDITALTLNQIFNVCYSPRRTKRIVVGNWIIMFVRRGRVFATHNVETFPAPVDMGCGGIVEVVPWGDTFWILGKNYLACTMETVINKCHFYHFSFDAVQVIGAVDQQTHLMRALILASDGRVLTTTFSWKRSYSPMVILGPLPVISYMVSEGDTVKLVDVDNRVWLVESVVPLEVKFSEEFGPSYFGEDSQTTSMFLTDTKKGSNEIYKILVDISREFSVQPRVSSSVAPSSTQSPGKIAPFPSLTPVTPYPTQSSGRTAPSPSPAQLPGRSTFPGLQPPLSIPPMSAPSFSQGTGRLVLPGLSASPGGRS